MLTVIAFASVVISTYGQTRFVIDNYTIPDTSDPAALFLGTAKSLKQGSPYPLDICVGYEIDFTIDISGGLDNVAVDLFSLYGIYSCNDEGTEVTFTDYGSDSKCQTPVNEKDKTLAYDATIAAGLTGTFNCDGENNYVTIVQYTVGLSGPSPDGGNICCPDGGDYSDSFYGLAPTTFATNVCVYGELDGTAGYSSGTCDSAGSTTTIYSDNTCETSTGVTNDQLSATSDGCTVLGAPTDDATLYQRQTNCVINDVAMDPDTAFSCVTDDPTPEPTPVPTPDTDSPTSAPTDEPTEATPSPTEPKDEEAKGFMAIVDYVVLLILGMAIFVN